MTHAKRLAGGLVLLAALRALGSAPAAAKTGDDSELSPEMKQEMAKTQETNLENTLEHAVIEAGRAHLRLRGLLDEASGDVKAGQDRLDVLIQDPSAPSSDKLKESREALSVSAGVLPAKIEAFAAKAGSAGVVAASADKAAAKTGYANNPKDRAADLKQARSTLKLAQGRWGEKALKPAHQELVDALADCLAEINAAVEQASAASGLVSPTREKPLFETVARLRTRSEDAAREAEILRIELLLTRYDEDRRKAPVDK